MNLFYIILTYLCIFRSLAVLFTEICGVLSLGSSRVSHMTRNGIRPMSVKTRETLSSKCQSLAAPIGICARV